MRYPALLYALASSLVITNVNGAEPRAPKPEKNKDGQASSVASVVAPIFQPKLWNPNAPLLSYVVNDPKKIFKWLGAKIAAVPGLPDRFSSPEQEKAYQAALIAAMARIGPIAIPTRCKPKMYYPANQEYKIGWVRVTPPIEMSMPISAKTLNLQTLFLKQYILSEETIVMQDEYGFKFNAVKSNADDFSILYSGLPGSEPTTIFKEPEKEKKYIDELAKWLASPAKDRNSGSALYYQFHFSEYEITVPMKSNEARVNDADIMCMDVVSIEHPYIHSHDELISATQKFPKQSTIHNHYIYGKLDRVIVFNQKTGKLYAEAKRDGL